MATINVKCPQCGSIKVVKHGKTEPGYQRYYCVKAEPFWRKFDMNVCPPFDDINAEGEG
jgi:ribosomal protein S27AE